MSEEPTQIPAIPDHVRGFLPSVLAGREKPAVVRQVEGFYQAIAAIFEAWVTRRDSLNTRRSYREGVMAFVRYMEWRWPEDAQLLLTTSVLDVLEFRDALFKAGAAEKTVNHRISSLSSFYKYLSGAAAEFRLPITVPNPAHAQFIARSSSDPRKETRALSATRSRQLMSMPSGESVFDARDRAILKTFLYTGIRLGTACRLKVSDFHQDGDERRSVSMRRATSGEASGFTSRRRRRFRNTLRRQNSWVGRSSGRDTARGVERWVLGRSTK